MVVQLGYGKTCVPLYPVSPYAPGSPMCTEIDDVITLCAQKLMMSSKVRTSLPVMRLLVMRLLVMLLPVT